MKIIAATQNQGKLREFQRILNPYGFTVISQQEAGIDLDIEETGQTFEENACLKARAIYDRTGLPTLADDSGLAVDVLNGAPGIYSARYANFCTGSLTEGNADDTANYMLLLEQMKEVPEAERTARFVCTLCYISADGEAHLFRGECEGKIGFHPSGSEGFGYDPIFYWQGRSFGELSGEEKDRISHRGQALRMLEEYIQKHEHR